MLGLRKHYSGERFCHYLWFKMKGCIWIHYRNLELLQVEAWWRSAMGPQEDYIETVVTCEGDFHDPQLPHRLEFFRRQLKDLLLAGMFSCYLVSRAPSDKEIVIWSLTEWPIWCGTSMKNNVIPWIDIKIRSHRKWKWLFETVIRSSCSFLQFWSFNGYPFLPADVNDL